MSKVLFNKETKVWEGPKVPYEFDSATSIGAELLKSLELTPERVLHICHDDDSSMTCEQTKISSIRISQNLMKLGFKCGDVFGFICRNSTQLPAAIYGSILIGAPINPLDVAFKKEDIVQMFTQTQPKLVFCDADVYEKTKLALDELENKPKIVTLRDKIDGVSYIEDLLATTGNEHEFVAPYLGDASESLAAILCSSGTSGHMKGVCLSHANILGYLKIFNHPEAFRSLSFSPIYWLIGFVSTIFVALRQNDTRIMTSQTFDVDLLVKIIKKHNVNYFQAAPYQLSLLVQSPNLDPRDFIGIKIFFVIGSMVTENLRKEFHSVFPRHPLIIAYGMSESCMSISTTDPKDKIGGLTVGKISPNIHVKIVDQDGQAQDINRTGEILAKPEFKMLGYYNNPEASKCALDEDGYLRTGDIGYIDENGVIFIIDRKKDIMKHKGYQINPSEIENIIAEIEGVELVSVVGIPHQTATNLPAAVIVKRPEFEDLTEQFIMDYVAEKLPEYKHLHGGAYFVDEIPMTTNGKVQKRFVKVLAMKEYNERLTNLMNIIQQDDD